MAGIIVEQAGDRNNVSGLLRQPPTVHTEKETHTAATPTSDSYESVEEKTEIDNEKEIDPFIPTPNPICNVEFSEEDISEILQASNTTSPILEKKTSIQEERKSVEEEKEPIQDEKKPTEEEKKTLQEDKKPLQEDKKPMQEETLPIPVINEPPLEEAPVIDQSIDSELDNLTSNIHDKDSSLSLSPTFAEGPNGGRRRSSSPQLSFIQASDIVTMTRPELVAKEIILTEKAYVNDLQSIIEGYLYHVFRHGPPGVDIEKIFSNLEEIYDFNRTLVEELDLHCYVPDEVAECFVEKAKGFNTLYSQYCTSYPEASAYLGEMIFDSREVAMFFQERQKALGHALPLETYLLKPVQRITKYHMLFQDMLKHYDTAKPGYAIIKAAAEDMTDVADYINEVKRLQEDIVKTHDALEAIVGIESLDVYKTGRLVLENNFRVQGYRGDRHLFLFEKLLLICKRIDEHFFQFKNGILCSNMMLVESTGKDPTCFRIIRFDNQKIIYNIQARSAGIKWSWVQHLKRLLLENHPALVPVTAKEAILGANKKHNRNSKFNSLGLDSNDDLSEKLIRQQKNKAVTSGKENRSSPVISLKRTSSSAGSGTGSGGESSSEKEKKPSLNAKAREFLDRKSKMLQIVTSAVEKSDRNGRPWRFRKSIKQLKSPTSPPPVSKSPIPSTPPADSLQTTGGIKRDRLPALKKSKSMESLRSVSAAEFDLDMSLPQPLHKNADGDQPTENQAVPDDVVRKQIHRLSMLHELFAIDLARDTNVSNTLAANSDSISREQSLPMDVDSDVTNNESESNGAVVRRKQSRSRPLSLLGEEQTSLKKHHSDADEQQSTSRKPSMELSNQLIRCHSAELHRRIGSSRETVLIDNIQLDTEIIDDGNDNIVDVPVETENTIDEGDESVKTDDNDNDCSTESKDEHLQSDDDGAVIQTTLRKVNEAFSVRESISEDNISKLNEISDNFEDNDSALRRRTQSAFACLDTNEASDNKDELEQQEDSAFIDKRDTDGDISSAKKIELMPTHGRCNSEGSVTLTHRIDSVQSELDEACEDFSLVVAEMESPHTIPYETQTSRTPVRYAAKVTNTNIIMNDSDKGRDRAEAKIVSRRRPSSDKGPSRDFKSVSDRIRDYSYLVGPRSIATQNIDELFESLDTSTEESSSAYRDQRRRLSSRKTPLKRCDSQPTPSEHRNDVSKLRSRTVSAESSINATLTTCDRNQNEIACHETVTRGDRKSMSLPRRFSLNQVTDSKSSKTTKLYSFMDSDRSNGSPLFYDPRYDQSTPIKSPFPSFNNYQTTKNTTTDSPTSKPQRRWSHECGSIVSTLRPKQQIQSKSQTLIVNGSSHTRTPSIRYIQRSIVHRRVKEYIENVIKPSERMLPSARQRTRLSRDGIIEEQTTDAEDGLLSPSIEAVEKGTVERLRGKFAGVAAT